MLYLARKVGESIIINNNIEVQVVEVKGKTVKLGFNFPSDVSVLRKELHDRILQENLAASTADDVADFFGASEETPEDHDGTAGSE